NMDDIKLICKFFDESVEELIRGCKLLENYRLQENEMDYLLMHYMKKYTFENTEKFCNDLRKLLKLGTPSTKVLEKIHEKFPNTLPECYMVLVRTPNKIPATTNM